MPPHTPHSHLSWKPGDRVTYTSLRGPETGTVIRVQSTHQHTFRVRSDRGPIHIAHTDALTALTAHTPETS